MHQVLHTAWCVPGWVEALLALACFLSLHYFRQRKEPVIDWPILHHLPALLIHLPHVHDWTTSMHSAIGPTIPILGPIFSNMDRIITCDPQNLEYMLKTRFSNFPKGKLFHDMFEEFLGDGIFNIDGDAWEAQRRTANSHVHSKGFRSFVAATSRGLANDRLVPLLRKFATEGAAIDLQEIMMRYTMDTACAAVFGESVGCLSEGLPNVPFANAINDAMQAVTVRHVLPTAWWRAIRWLGLGMEPRLERAVRTMDEFVAQQVARRRHVSSGRGGGDLLSVYAATKASKTDRYLRDVAVNFLLAGRDTTGAALTWFFWLVSTHQNIEAKIIEELKAKGTDDHRELVYLHAALCETIRLYPSVPLDHKCALEEDILPDGTILKSETMVHYSIYAMGRMEWLWGKDCLEFRPERWLGEDGRLKGEGGFRFLAFNGGPRTCVGRDLAFVQMKYAASAVLSAFQLELVKGHRVSPKTSVILVMKKGLMVRVKEREGSW
ncbi:cytochrome P450 86B1-like [Amborella trichopoda]|uniref:cytochrome P450 86B1-like n=1 Tax=Amborella trichopoda TaxID=13333 RepID=UPI0009BE8B19|nr:cytochrome P450 86B1-like [Amborella trichopoda]|eukprot:XP_020532250.1 cytochrome P450 86B1-like [Amborella trichopoda]